MPMRMARRSIRCECLRVGRAEGWEDAELRLNHGGGRRECNQACERDKIDPLKLGNNLQSITLDVTRSAQAGADLVEVGIAIAWVSNKLPSAGREFLEQRPYGVGVHNASRRDGNGAIGRGEAFFRENASKVGTEFAQGVDLGAAYNRRARRGVHRPLRLKGIAHGANPSGPRGA